MNRLFRIEASSRLFIADSIFQIFTFLSMYMWTDFKGTFSTIFILTRIKILIEANFGGVSDRVLYASDRPFIVDFIPFYWVFRVVKKNYFHYFFSNRRIKISNFMNREI